MGNMQQPTLMTFAGTAAAMDPKMFSSRTRVVVVDDDPAITKLLQHWLTVPAKSDAISSTLSEAEKPVFEVTCFATLGAAIPMAIHASVVLLDLTLTDIKGLDTLRAMCAAVGPRVPIAVLSAREAIELARGAIEAGADDFLPKSHVNRDMLMRLLASAMERRRIQLRLESAEALLSLVLNESQRPVAVYDESSKLAAANRAWLRKRGLPERYLRYEGPHDFAGLPEIEALGRKFYPATANPSELLGEPIAGSNGPLAAAVAAGKRQLTTRELEVLGRVASGGSKKQVAAELEISPRTIDRHVSNIMHKLGIHDRVALSRYAIREGIIDP